MSLEHSRTGRAREGPTLRRVMGPRLLLLFIVGDILGTGVYALTGQVAGQVGGLVWVPFLVAFAVATITAFSYLELVTKYPRAAGAALYAHKAFGIHILTFLVCFVVMASGVTSASTAAKAFAANLALGFGLDWGPGAVTAAAIAFITLVALVNLRGVGESVRANVVLTLVELSGLLLVLGVGLYALTQGQADLSRITVFESPDGKNAFLAVTAATSLAFFAMVGFEDSVNMAEETTDPVGLFPRIMLTGLGITGALYVLVSMTAVALVPVGVLAAPDNATPLFDVVSAGAPGFPTEQVFPFISMFAVANSALINMLMASRLLYGMAQEDVLPRQLGWVHATRRTPWVAIIVTSVLAVGLISLSGDVATLGGTTALLLLGVFTVVNIACLVLRKDPVEHAHFVAPRALPVLGALSCAYLTGPWTGRDPGQYTVAGWLVLLGTLVWALTWFSTRRTVGRSAVVTAPSDPSGGTGVRPASDEGGRVPGTHPDDLGPPL